MHSAVPVSVPVNDPYRESYTQGKFYNVWIKWHMYGELNMMAIWWITENKFQSKHSWTRANQFTHNRRLDRSLSKYTAKEQIEEQRAVPSPASRCIWICSRDGCAHSPPQCHPTYLDTACNTAADIPSTEPLHTAVTREQPTHSTSYQYKHHPVRFHPIQVPASRSPYLDVVRTAHMCAS